MLLGLALLGVADPVESPCELAIRDQPLLELREVERFHEVMDRTELHRRAHALHVAGGGDHEEVRARPLYFQGLAEQVQSIAIRQIDVEQHEPRRESLDLGPAAGERGGVPGDIEAVHAAEVGPVNRGYVVIVFDDQRLDHARTSDCVGGSASVGTASGRTTVKTVLPTPRGAAPPLASAPLPDAKVTVPPDWRTRRWTRARPIPRCRSGSAGLVLK